MSRSISFLAPLVALALVGCVTPGRVSVEPVASATLVQGNGLPAGTALITAAGDGLTLRLVAAGLPPGGHGVHLHAVGRCAAAGFTDAGAHLNPAAKQHGTDNPAGSHVGDLPNLIIAANGTGALEALLPGDRAQIEAALFDGDGTALVIHAALDDYRTDPSGNSGTRIACGVLERRD